MSFAIFRDVKGCRIGVQVSGDTISMDNLDSLGIVQKPIILPLTEFIKMVDFIVAGYGGELTEELWNALKKRVARLL
jgi:hypothetical protein